MKLSHYTCARNAKLILADGYLKARPQPLFGMKPLLFFTDLVRANPQLLRRVGLTWHTGREGCGAESPPCRPMHCRFALDVDLDEFAITRFTNLRDEYPAAVAVYSALPGAQPWRWYASPVSIPLSRRKARV